MKRISLDTSAGIVALAILLGTWAGMSGVTGVTPATATPGESESAAMELAPHAPLAPLAPLAPHAPHALLAPHAPLAPGPAGKRVRLTGDDQQIVRRGPAYGYAILGLYPAGSTFQVITRSGEWYIVRLSDQETGWIHASHCEVLDDLSKVAFRPNPRLYSRLGSFVVTAYAGGYSFDRKSNSPVLGGRLGYYVLSFLEVEGGLAWSHIERPREVVESLFGVSLESEEFHMLFYHLNVTLELLPGRQMVPFVTTGVGSTIMQGKTESGINFGAGTTLFVSKRTAMRWEFRDYRFDAGSRGARRTHNNLEFTFGTSYLF